MTEREIFIAAAQIESPDERAAFLDQACGGDDDLKKRLNALLAEQDKLGSFLEAPVGNVATIEHKPQASERLGMQIGPYKLLQKLGEGGMGAVYLAEQQEPVKRQVALKIIKAGMDSALVIARFEQERQALAIMDHPHIAKVLDAGTTESGRPYFVMELVKGIPITRYCDQEHLSPKERLELFIPVCQAVQHAHQKGIIHRDLKPSNVLIALYDGHPVPKVIDFGVAKATSQKLTERTLFTEVGSIVGTLEYMAPEQAELNNLDIDTRADIYSLGVLLYELLAGAPPFTSQQLRSAGFNEMLRIIKEVEPPKPSTKISGSAELPSIAANRKLEPKRLTKLVRGDLDWIVMKCLEKDRGRRYETANAFALDIQRYLDSEPVLAGPPSALYRFSKFIRRNKGPVLAVAAILLLLISGIIGTTFGLVRAKNAEANARAAEAEARQQRDQARLAAEQEKKAKDAEAAQRQNAESVASVLESVFKRLDPREASDDLKGLLLKRMEEVEAALQKDYAGEPLVRARLLHTIAWTQFGLGDIGKALPLVQQAADERRTHLGPDHPDTLMSVELLAICLMRNGGQIEKALPLAEEVLAKRRIVLGPDDRETLNAMDNLSELYMASGKNKEALALLEEAYVKKQVAFGPDHLWTLHCAHNLAAAYYRTGQRQKALALHEPTVAKARELFPGHNNTIGAMRMLASWYRDEGQTEKSLSMSAQAMNDAKASLGMGHSITWYSMEALATAYRAAGKYADAIPLYVQLRDYHVAKNGPDHQKTLETNHNLAWAYQNTNQFVEATKVFKETHERSTAKLGADHISTLNTLNGLAWSYQRTGKSLEAIPLFEQVLGGLGDRLGPNSSLRGSTLNGLAQSYDVAKQYANAAQSRRQYLDIIRQRTTTSDMLVADTLFLLGKSLLLSEQYVDAEATWNECLVLRKAIQPESWLIFHTTSYLGAALAGQKKYAASEKHLLAGYEGMKQRELMIPTNVRRIRLNEAVQRLIDLYSAWDKPDDAARWGLALQPPPQPDTGVKK